MNRDANQPCECDSMDGVKGMQRPPGPAGEKEQQAQQASRDGMKEQGGRNK